MRRRRRRAVKFGVIGEARSEIKRLRRRRLMNARHIGDNFTSLLYIAVTSSVFLYKQPRERVELDLSHPHPPTVIISHPRTFQLTISVWGGG